MFAISGHQRSALLCALLATLFQRSALAATDYVVTGNFYGDLLEVTQDDGEPVDGFIYPQSPFTPATSFTLRFSVDESVAGRSTIFNPAIYF